VQLIPAWIDNVQRVMPKGEVVPVPILCTVTFGAPLALKPSEDKRALPANARAGPSWTVWQATRTMMTACIDPRELSVEQQVACCS
jgi:hypothetical protein